MRLAIDTSTSMASIALSQGGDVVAELTWRSEQNHSVELLPHLIHLLNQGRVALADIDAVIVARGPGSYNGLRVGMSTAKGLAMSLGVPMVGIGTLEVAAFPYRGLGLSIYALHAAGRGEIAAARFQQKRGRWLKSLEEHITTIDELCLGVAQRSLFCGEISPFMALELRERLGRRAVVIAGELRRAGFLALLGEERLWREDFDDPTTLQPLYLRRPPITMPKQK
jgi:tRNA threonylcarbamoyl adenosine modification protein YeaZ